MPSNPRSRYQPVKPLFTKAELKKLDSAFNKFYKKKESFDKANANAKKAVQLTLAWVGVGEKLVSLAGSVIEQRKSEASTTSEKKRLTKLQKQVDKFAELAELLSVELPIIS